MGRAWPASLRLSGKNGHPIERIMRKLLVRFSEQGGAPFCFFSADGRRGEGAGRVAGGLQLAKTLAIVRGEYPDCRIVALGYMAP